MTRERIIDLVQSYAVPDRREAARIELRGLDAEAADQLVKVTDAAYLRILAAIAAWMIYLALTSLVFVEFFFLPPGLNKGPSWAAFGAIQLAGAIGFAYAALRLSRQLALFSEAVLEAPGEVVIQKTIEWLRQQVVFTGPRMRERAVASLADKLALLPELSPTFARSSARSLYRWALSFASYRPREYWAGRFVQEVIRLCPGLLSERELSRLEAAAEAIRRS